LQACSESEGIQKVDHRDAGGRIWLCYDATVDQWIIVPSRPEYPFVGSELSSNTLQFLLLKVRATSTLRSLFDNNQSPGRERLYKIAGLDTINWIGSFNLSHLDRRRNRKMSPTRFKSPLEKQPIFSYRAMTGESLACMRHMPQIAGPHWGVTAIGISCQRCQGTLEGNRFVLECVLKRCSMQELFRA